MIYSYIMYKAREIEHEPHERNMLQKCGKLLSHIIKFYCFYEEYIVYCVHSKSSKKMDFPKISFPSLLLLQFAQQWLRFILSINSELSYLSIQHLKLRKVFQLVKRS